MRRRNRVLQRVLGSLSPPGYRSRVAAASRWSSGREKNFRKSTASLGEPFVTSQPLRPPSVSEAAPLPPGVVGNGNQPSWSSGEALLVRRVRAHAVEHEVALQVHRPLAVAELARRLRKRDAEEARLKRLEVGELAQLLAGLDERRGGEALALAAHRRFERGLAAVAHGEIGPVEVDRPLVGAADDDRRHARSSSAASPPRAGRPRS